MKTLIKNKFLINGQINFSMPAGAPRSPKGAATQAKKVIARTVSTP